MVPQSITSQGVNTSWHHNEVVSKRPLITTERSHIVDTKMNITPREELGRCVYMVFIWAKGMLLPLGLEHHIQQLLGLSSIRIGGPLPKLTAGEMSYGALYQETGLQ